MTIRLKIEFVSADAGETEALERGLTGTDTDAILAAEHAITEALYGVDVAIELGAALDAIARGGRAKREHEAAQLLEETERAELARRRAELAP